MKFPALYRRYKDSPILQTYYSVETNSLFELEFELPYPYLEEYAVDFNDLNDITLSLMYESFYDRKDVLAVVLINNFYLALLYPDSLYIRSAAIRNEDMSYTRVKIDKDFSSYGKEVIVPVGFERTFVPTLRTFIPPGRIYYSAVRKKIFYKNKWTDVLGSTIPEEFLKKSLYKELVKHPEANGIIYVGNNKTILLD